MRDNGRGIDPEDLGRIFELFAQGEAAPGTADSGLGVGLTLARQLVRAAWRPLDGEQRWRGQGLGVLVPHPARQARVTALRN